MFSTASKGLGGVAALAALALGGSAIADAATGTSTTSSGSNAAQTAPQGQPPAGGPGGPGGARGGHTANGKTETLLTGDTAAKVKAAALNKVPGGTIERVETDADFGSPYEAHVRKADGTSVQVLVNSSFDVTAVKSMR